MEACGSSHHWAREIQRLGHEVLLISPQYVTPFRLGNKNDYNDAQAIAEAASRPQMRFVVVKSIEQQSILMLHRMRERLVKQRTALINLVSGINWFAILMMVISASTTTGASEPSDLLLWVAKHGYLIKVSEVRAVAASCTVWWKRPKPMAWFLPII